MEQILFEEWRFIRRELANIWFYPIVFIASICALYAPNGQDGSLFAIIFLAVLLALQALVDIRTRLLTHSLNMLIFLSGTVLAPLFLEVAWWEALVVPIVLPGLFWGMGWVASRMAKQPALGMGDIWLICSISPWLGVMGTVPFLVATAILGVAWVSFQRVMFPAERRVRFAFGGILGLAAWLAVTFGEYYWHFILFLRG